jgi:histidinol dehydrogenase
MAIIDILRLDSRAGRRKLSQLLCRGETLLDAGLLRRTAKIVDAVRLRGDRALLRAARRFDGVGAESVEALRLSIAPVDPALLPTGLERAFEQALAQIERYHAHQRHDGFTLERDGMRLEERRFPLRRVGVYVPGGRAAYPSTVLMTVIPARLAGVDEVVVATPLAGFARSAALRYALHRLDVREVWGLGGAQAVAALAYGTETIGRVDKIVGPGNRWVTAAKFLVSNRVAIDGLAGPSEVLIVASGECEAELIAADLLAQAEHDPQACAVLLTDDSALAKRVRRALRAQLEFLPTAATARAALANVGAILLLDDLDRAPSLIDALAPEHLQLLGRAEAFAPEVRNAGAIFVGASTPEVFGDYLAGPSHVLPTAGTARFASALGVDDFVRRSHVVAFSPEAAARAATDAAILADVEGLPAHARAARARIKPEGAASSAPTPEKYRSGDMP